MKTRLRILGLNIKITFQRETAYWANNWANMLSTLIYTATFLFFVNIIFANVKLFGGYTKNEMLLYILLSQITFYICYTWSYDNLDEISADINSGNLDLTLLKPMPQLFYLTTRTISIISLLRDALIPLLFVAWLINWPTLSLACWPVVAGLVILLAGMFLIHCMQFLLMLPGFWWGQSRNLLNLSYGITNPDLPWESLTKPIQFTLTVIVPILIAPALAVSVILGKSDPELTLLWVSGLVIIGFWIRNWGWRLGLQNYASASS